MQAQVDVKKLESQGADGVLKSTVSGVVGTVGDPAVLADGEVLLDIAGGSGYVIRAVIGELSLEKLAVGSMMNVFSYETGVSCTGRVSEIGDIPVSGYYDGGNGNSSGYIVTVRVEDPDVQLKNWEGVELSMITDGKMCIRDRHSRRCR